jgi:hypothetical protein
MTGAVEGGVQVATGFMDAMKREPLSLALVLMNLCLLLFFYVILNRVADQRKEEIALLYADKKEVRELLAKCVIPDRKVENELPMMKGYFELPRAPVPDPPKPPEQ